MSSDSEEGSMTPAQRLQELEEQEMRDENEQYKFECFMIVYAPLFFQEDKVLVGDQVILPASLLDQFTKRRFSFPFFFKATNTLTNTTVSCRAYEFTAPPGIVIFSELLMEELFLENGSEVRLRLCEIPKATYLRLKPEGSDYLRWSNQKAVLETAIKAYGTVTLHKSILLHFGGKSHRFEIVGLRPAPHANLIDTDVTVELEKEVTPVAFDFSVDKQESEEKKEEPEETEPVISTKETNTATEAKKPRRRRRRGEDQEEVEETKPAVQSFAGKGHAMGNIASAHTIDTPTTQTSGNSLQSDDTTAVTEIPAEQPPNTKLCTNCKKYVPDYTFDRHEAFCQRNNYCCPICDQVMPKSKETQHHEEVHKPIPCPDCGSEMEPGLIPTHLEESCPQRKIRCEFCMLAFDAASFVDHATLCGARTELCDKCRRYVMLRDMVYHSENDCSEFPADILEESSSETPEDSTYNDHYNYHDYNSRSYDNFESWESFPSNDSQVDDLSFCPVCMAPFLSQSQLIEHTEQQLDMLIVMLGEGNANEIQTILSHSPDLSDDNVKKNLIFAGLKGNSDVLGILINNKSIPADMELDGKSLLHHAAANNKCNTLEAIIEQDVNLNIFDSNKNSPLHEAASAGAVECIKKLLDTKRVSATLKNDQEQTPIDCCLQSEELSDQKKVDILTLFFTSCNMTQVSFDDQYSNFVKEAFIDLLTLCYWGKLENESVFVKNILEILKGNSKERIIEIQKEFNERVTATQTYVSATVGAENSIGEDNILTLKLQNSGCLRFAYELLFPEGSEFTLKNENTAVAPSDETTITIEMKGDDSSKTNCLIVKCKNSDSTRSDIDSYYCLVPVRS